MNVKIDVLLVPVGSNPFVAPSVPVICVPKPAAVPPFSCQLALIDPEVVTAEVKNLKALRAGM